MVRLWECDVCAAGTKESTPWRSAGFAGSRLLGRARGRANSTSCLISLSFCHPWQNAPCARPNNRRFSRDPAKRSIGNHRCGNHFLILIPGSLESRRAESRAQGATGHGWPVESEMRQDVEFARPRARLSARAPAQPATLQGVLTLAYFSLHKQREVGPRRPGVTLQRTKKS